MSKRDSPVGAFFHLPELEVLLAALEELAIQHRNVASNGDLPESFINGARCNLAVVEFLREKIDLVLKK